MTTVRKPLTEEHKDALKRGRYENAAVERYLEALGKHRPRRGRRRTSESIEKRLLKIEHDLPGARNIKRLDLLQEMQDLKTEQASMQESVDLAEVENEFVAVAPNFSRRKHIAYEVWRTMGVPADVLRRAGLSRHG